jgi:hypothetical protein
MAITKPNTAKNINKIVKQSLIYQHSQNWHANLQNSNKGRNFSIYKENIMLEQYLLKLNKSEAMQLLKFRTGNHFFPTETGRWNNIILKTGHVFCVISMTHQMKCIIYSSVLSLKKQGTNILRNIILQDQIHSNSNSFLIQIILQN